MRAEGSYRYGPDISRNLACARARLDLRINALRAFAGERLSQFSSLSCDSSDIKFANNECRLRENIWSYLGAGVFVRSLEIDQESDRAMLGGRVCNVSGSVVLNRMSGAGDPMFLTQIKISPSSRLQEGEVFSIELSSSRESFHYLFSWDLDSDNQALELLFPNQLDDDNWFNESLRLPTEDSRGDYDFRAILNQGDSYALEQLVLFSSKASLGEQPTIANFAELMRVASGMKRNDWTMSELSYEITKP